MEKFSVKKPFTVLVAVIMVIMLGLVSVHVDKARRKRRAGDFHFFHISSFPFLRWIIARIIPQILRRGYYDFLFFAQFRRQTLFSIHIH